MTVVISSSSPSLKLKISCVSYIVTMPHPFRLPHCPTLVPQRNKESTAFDVRERIHTHTHTDTDTGVHKPRTPVNVSVLVCIESRCSGRSLQVRALWFFGGTENMYMVRVDVWVARRGYVHYSFICSHWFLRMQQRPRHTHTHSHGEHACGWDETMIYTMYSALSISAPLRIFGFDFFSFFFFWFSNFSVYIFPLFFFFRVACAHGYCLSFVLSFSVSTFFFIRLIFLVCATVAVAAVAAAVATTADSKSDDAHVACVRARLRSPASVYGWKDFFFIYLLFFLASNAARQTNEPTKKKITHKHIRVFARPPLGREEHNTFYSLFFFFSSLDFFFFGGHTSTSSNRAFIFEWWWLLYGLVFVVSVARRFIPFESFCFVIFMLWFSQQTQCDFFSCVYLICWTRKFSVASSVLTISEEGAEKKMLYRKWTESSSVRQTD